ncbi:MAG: hypothetical protein ACYC9L_03035 [Sulfuricaulis sp.]
MTRLRPAAPPSPRGPSQKLGPLRFWGHESSLKNLSQSKQPGFDIRCEDIGIQIRRTQARDYRANASVLTAYTHSTQSWRTENSKFGTPVAVLNCGSLQTRFRPAGQKFQIWNTVDAAVALSIDVGSFGAAIPNVERQEATVATTASGPGLGRRAGNSKFGTPEGGDSILDWRARNWSPGRKFQIWNPPPGTQRKSRNAAPFVPEVPNLERRKLVPADALSEPLLSPLTGNSKFGTPTHSDRSVRWRAKYWPGHRKFQIWNASVAAKWGRAP